MRLIHLAHVFRDVIANRRERGGGVRGKFQRAAPAVRRGVAAFGGSARRVGGVGHGGVGGVGGGTERVVRLGGGVRGARVRVVRGVRFRLCGFHDGGRTAASVSDTSDASERATVAASFAADSAAGRDAAIPETISATPFVCAANTSFADAARASPRRTRFSRCRTRRSPSRARRRRVARDSPPSPSRRTRASSRRSSSSRTF